MFYDNPLWEDVPASGSQLCICPILPASNAFSGKKGKMVTQGGMCDSHLCPELDHVSEVYDSVLRNEDIRCNLSFQESVLPYFQRSSVNFSHGTSRQLGISN